QGLPFGVTLVAGAFEDADLLQMAACLQAHTGDRAGALDAAALSLQHPPDEFPDLDAGSFIDVAACGAHMDGLPLNGQLTSRGAWRVATTHTAAIYRLFALAGGPPHRPGLLRVAQGGAAVEIEIWRLPREHFADFVAAIPAPLGIGRLRVADGSEVCGFLCEAAGVHG